MFMASKFEEIYAPEVKDFVYDCDKTYSKEDILGRYIPITSIRNGKQYHNMHIIQYDAHFLS